MKIAGFNVSKTALVVGGIFLAFIIAFSGLGYINKRKQKQADAEKAAAALAEQERQIKLASEWDYDAVLQKQLIEKYGQPQDGFRWSLTGELVAIGTDELTAEDILYTFVRSLSVLDFATAQKYSRDSSVVATYQDYYGVISEKVTDYYSDFLRKQYKIALTSIEINDVKDVAVFADGAETITLNLAMLDLTDKDFWRKDKKKIFKALRTFADYESDNTKKDQYIYDYILKSYEDGSIGKRDIDIELALSKDNGGGWFVTNDQELNSNLLYEYGVDTAKYIDSEYHEWLVSQKINGK